MEDETQNPAREASLAALPRKDCWRCSFSRWDARGDGVFRTRLKPDLLLRAWVGANLLIVWLVLLRSPSAMVTLGLTVMPVLFVAHGLWMLLRRTRIQVSLPDASLSIGPSMGRRTVISLQGLRAVQMVAVEAERAADGSAMPPDLQINLVYESGDRRALLIARWGSAESALEPGAQLAKMLSLPFLDTGDRSTEASDG